MGWNVSEHGHKALTKDPAGACATKLYYCCQPPLSFVWLGMSLLLLSLNSCPALPALGGGCLHIFELCV